MGIRLMCDGGCGKYTDTPTEYKQVGLSIRRYYCPECMNSVDVFMKAREEIMAEAMSVFNKKYEKLVAALKKAHPGMELPDAN